MSYAKMYFFLLPLFSVSLCLCGGFCVAHAAETPRVLTLDEARAVAAEKNRDVEKAREYRNYVMGRYVEERAAALPRLSLDASASRSRDQGSVLFAGSGAFADQGTAQVNLSQALFTWGQIGAALRAAREGLLLAENQVRLYRQAALRDVTASFYDVLLADELHRLALHSEAQKKRHLEEARGKFALGVATDYDVLAAEVSAQNARPDVVRTGNSIRLTRDRLRFLLGSPAPVDPKGSLEANASVCPSYEEAMETALRKRPELADLAHRKKIGGELVTIARAGDKPRLDLKAGAGYGAMEIGKISGSGSSWNAGLSLSWPFFDGLKTRGRVAQARSDLDSLEIEERKTVDAVTLQVRVSVDAVREAGEIVSGISGTVAQAERLLAMAEKGYELGVKNRIEVEDAELNLLQARGNLARARRDLLVACSDLQWAMGVLGEERPTHKEGR